MRVPVLTYHSMNISGNDYTNNDHVALSQDLHTIRRLGMHIARLSQVIDALRGIESESVVENAVAISFDDGSWFDWHDLDHPSHGRQRSMAAILRDFAATSGSPVHATSFVIVSPEARATLEQTCMIGLRWWGDDWWHEASREGLLAIENHSWDHNHETLPSTAARAHRGTFKSIETYGDADAEIRQAADWLDTRLAPQRSTLFAFPYGESNEYLLREYLPRFQHEHRLLAAFGTEPRPLESTCNRWNLPRFVCGMHWRTPEELEALLRSAA